MGWVKRLRVTAEVCALALVAGACSVSNPVVGPPSANPPAGRTPGVTPAPSSPGTTLHPTTIPRSSTTTGIAGPPPVFADDGSVGAMARVYLQPSPATSLTIEVDAVSGRDPAQSALDHLSTVLHRELDKPAGIAILHGNHIPAGHSSWSVDDLVATSLTRIPCQILNGIKLSASPWRCH